MSCHDETSVSQVTPLMASNNATSKIMMMMYFHAEISDYFLLKQWGLQGNKDIGWMVLCAFVTFALAFVYEMLKQVTRWCDHRIKRDDADSIRSLLGERGDVQTSNSHCSAHCEVDESSGSEQPVIPTRSPPFTPRTSTSNDQLGNFQSLPVDGNDRSPDVIVRILPLLCGLHLVQATVYSLQLFISYLLMLIAMTCSVWLLGALFLGSTFGYFVFEWRTLPDVAMCHTTGCEQSHAIANATASQTTKSNCHSTPQHGTTATCETVHDSVA